MCWGRYGGGMYKRDASGDMGMATLPIIDGENFDSA